MKNVFTKLLTLFIVIFSFSSISANEKLLKDNTKVLILGDSITQAGGYVSAFETWFISKYPKRNVTFINGGLASETVSGLSEESHMKHGFSRPDLHERLIRVMDNVKPDLIIACYGMNCGIYLEYDKDRFKAYAEGITKLRKVAKEYKADIIHVTPPIYDNHQNEGFDYNTVLDKYSEWLVKYGKKKGWKVIDLHFEMKAKVLKAKEGNAKFTVQRDKIHPNGVGHWMMAQSLIKYFGDEEAAQKKNINEIADRKLSNAVNKRMKLRAAALHHATQPKRPTRKTPLEKVQPEIEQLNQIIDSFKK